MQMKRLGVGVEQPADPPARKAPLRENNVSQYERKNEKYENTASVFAFLSCGLLSICFYVVFIFAWQKTRKSHFLGWLLE